jgi:hypothetical protein
VTSEPTHNDVTFCCDVCGEVREPGGGARLGRGSAPRDWSEEWEDAKAEGWRARKVGDTWMHYCSDCR